MTRETDQTSLEPQLIHWRSQGKLSDFFIAPGGPAWAVGFPR